MAEETKTTTKEYIIPLRKQWLKVSRYRRAGRAAKTIKEFVAKHMKVPERDVDKVKMDPYINNEVWFRGKTKPPAKIKVRAIKEGEIVKVEFVETPQYVKFMKLKHAKFHAEVKKKEEKKPEVKPAEVKEEKPVEEKKEEKEKEKAGEQDKLKQAKQEKKVQKHTAKDKNVEFARRSMNRH